MAKTVRIEALGEAIAEELTLYSKDVQERVDAAGAESMEQLVSLTKATAPVDSRASHRHYRTMIASKAEPAPRGGTTYTWYVKPPGHRLTHLLVHGHATRDGGRTRANPFLQDALTKVLPEYERAIEEAIRK